MALRTRELRAERLEKAGGGRGGKSVGSTM